MYYEGMKTLYHGTAGNEFTAHIGLCLTDDQDIAEAYVRNGGNVVEVSLDSTTLNVVEVEVTRQMIDAQDWPGDSARSLASLQADGVDVVVYLDMTPDGRDHQTYRLVSNAAVEAVGR